MTATYWKGGDGNWQTAAKWTAGAPTSPTAVAVINAPGTYRVTVRSRTYYEAGSVTLNAAQATLLIDVDGGLQVTDSLTVAQGKLVLYGTISGGTLVQKGGEIDFERGAELSLAAFDGTMDFSTNNTTLTIDNSLTLHGSDGTGQGAILLGGQSQLTLVGAGSTPTAAGGAFTLNNAILTITGGQLAIDASALVLGPRMTVRYEAKYGVFPGANGAGGQSSTVSIINKGLFDVAKGAFLFFYPDPKGGFTNSGSLVLNGGSAKFSQLTNLSGGRVTLFAGSTLNVGSFDNKGVLTANGATITARFINNDYGTLNISNSTLELEDMNLPLFAKLKPMLAGHNNSVQIDLNIDNSDNTLELDMPAGFKSFVYAGLINGGTVTIGGTYSGVLENLTVQGSIDAKSLYLGNVTFADNGGIGQITLNGQLGAFSSNSLDNIDVTAGPASGLAVPTSGTFTLGANFTLKANGDFTAGAAFTDRNTAIVNNGTLEETGPGRFVVFGGALTNNGTIRVENGGTFVVSTQGGLSMDGGTYIIGAHSSLKLNRGSTGNVLGATVVMEGAGASFLSAGLATITAQGALTMENGATLSVASNFTIDGALHLAGSNFGSAHITIDAGGSLGGHGQVLGAVANNGTVDAAGGGLTITQDVSGTGQITIEDASALAVDGNVAAGQTVTFESASGRLALASAAGFAGTIADFAVGDVIRLIDTKATTVGYNAAKDTLTIRNNGALVATLQLTGDYSGDTFSLSDDGKGGTQITVAAAASAARLHRFVEAAAASSPSDMASVGTIVPANAGQASALLAAHTAH